MNKSPLVNTIPAYLGSTTGPGSSQIDTAEARYANRSPVETTLAAMTAEGWDDWPRVFMSDVV